MATIHNPTVCLPALIDDLYNTRSYSDGYCPDVFSVPPVNIKEDKVEYQMSLAAPGLNKKDLRIYTEGRMLIICCEKSGVKEESRERFTRKEYNYSSFSRNFTLPTDVAHEQIQATYDNGILTIRLPRKKEPSGRSNSMVIPVE